ncbi:MAG: hypothetical protein AAGM22_06605 [Acidobacteriota bacterium]
MSFDLAELLQLGFHGTALAFLLVGYRLMKQVLDDEDGDGLELRLRNVRFFLAVSVAVLVLGIGSQILVQHLDSKHEVEVHLSPSGMPESVAEPQISTLGAPPVVFEQGLGRITVGRKVPIRVVVDELVDKIEELMDQRDLLDAQLREREALLAREEGGGFDEDAG